MDVYWLKQVEGDVPPNDDWLSTSEAGCLGSHAVCETARRLAIGALDGQMRGVGISEFAASPGDRRNTRRAVRARPGLPRTPNREGRDLA